MRIILPGWFDHLAEIFSHTEVQFKKFCPPVKTSSPPAENVNETPEEDWENTFSCEWFGTCFDTEAKANSKMVYL